MKRKMNILLTAIFAVLIYILIQTGVQFIYTFVICFQNISYDAELSGAVFVAIFSMNQKKEILSLIAIILTSIIFYFKYYKNEDIRTIANITIKKCNIKQIIHMIITGILVTVLLYMVMLLLLKQGMVQNEGISLMDKSLSNMIIGVLIVGVIVPVFEEILFRGLVYGLFKYIFNNWLAIIIQGILFGIIHKNGVQYVYTFLLGIVVAMIYSWSKNIMNCIVIHIIFNILGTYVLPYITWSEKLIIISLIVSSILLVVSLRWQRKLTYCNPKS